MSAFLVEHLSHLVDHSASYRLTGFFYNNDDFKKFLIKQYIDSLATQHSNEWDVIKKFQQYFPPDRLVHKPKSKPVRNGPPPPESAHFKNGQLLVGDVDNDEKTVDSESGEGSDVDRDSDSSDETTDFSTDTDSDSEAKTESNDDTDSDSDSSDSDSGDDIQILNENSAAKGKWRKSKGKCGPAAIQKLKSNRRAKRKTKPKRKLQKIEGTAAAALTVAELVAAADRRNLRIARRRMSKRYRPQMVSPYVPYLPIPNSHKKLADEIRANRRNIHNNSVSATEFAGDNKGVVGTLNAIGLRQIPVKVGIPNVEILDSDLGVSILIRLPRDLYNIISIYANNDTMRRVCRYLHVMESQIIYQWHTSNASQLAKIPLNAWHTQFHTIKQLTINGPISNAFIHFIRYLETLPQTCPQLEKIYLYAKPSDSLISCQYPNYYTRVDHRLFAANNRNQLRDIDWLDYIVACRKLTEVHCTFFTSVHCIRNFLLFSRSRATINTFLVFGKYALEHNINPQTNAITNAALDDQTTDLPSDSLAPCLKYFHLPSYVSDEWILQSASRLANLNSLDVTGCIRYRQCGVTLNLLQYLSVFCPKLKYLTVTMDFVHKRCRVESIFKVITTIRALFEGCPLLHKLWIGVHATETNFDDAFNAGNNGEYAAPLPVAEALLSDREYITQFRNMHNLNRAVLSDVAKYGDDNKIIGPRLTPQLIINAIMTSPQILEFATTRVLTPGDFRCEIKRKPEPPKNDDKAAADGSKTNETGGVDDDADVQINGGTQSNANH